MKRKSKHQISGRPMSTIYSHLNIYNDLNIAITNKIPSIKRVTYCLKFQSNFLKEILYPGCKFGIKNSREGGGPVPTRRLLRIPAPSNMSRGWMVRGLRVLEAI